MIFHDTIVRIRPGIRTTRGGDEVLDYAPGVASRFTVPAVSVQPNTQADTTDSEGTLVTSSIRVITAPGNVPDIVDTDRVEWRGTVYAIAGDVQFWTDPHGQHHVEFQAKTFKGG